MADWSPQTTAAPRDSNARLCAVKFGWLIRNSLNQKVQPPIFMSSKNRAIGRHGRNQQIAIKKQVTVDTTILPTRLRFARMAGAARPLAAAIATESAIVLAILCTVAVWRFTPPPRALIAAEPASIHFHGGKAMAQIDVEPVRARGAEVSIEVLDGDFRPLAAKEVTIFLSNPTAGIEGVRRDAESLGTPRWRIDDLRIPVGGRWKLRVDILVDDFDKETLEDDVLLPRAP
jgi:copper transport protein